MSSLSSFVRLSNDKTTLIFDCQGRMPKVIYYGAPLSSATTPEMLSVLNTRQEAKCAPVIEPPITLVPTHGEGWTGQPGLEVSGNTDQWAAGFSLQKINRTDNAVAFIATDEARCMRLTTTVELDDHTSVVKYVTRLENIGDSTLNLHYLNAASLPLPTTVSKIKTFEGRWSAEFQTTDHDLFLVVMFAKTVVVRHHMIPFWFDRLCARHW